MIEQSIELISIVNAKNNYFKKYILEKKKTFIFGITYNQNFVNIITISLHYLMGFSFFIISYDHKIIIKGGIVSLNMVGSLVEITMQLSDHNNHHSGKGQDIP